MKKLQDDLLEDLMHRAGLRYLSDLHVLVYRRQIVKAMKDMEPGQYSTESWNEAVRYITGDETVACGSEGEAYSLLCRSLSGGFGDT